jgi:hypothetical protein
MAHTATLHLKVDVDNTAAAELAPRVKAAILDGLAFGRRVNTVFNEDVLAGTVAAMVMAEILRVRQVTPAEAAIARVRALHVEDYNACAWCSTNDRHVPWPCPTSRALGGEE